MTRFEVRTGDCLAVMRTLEDSSVDSIVTDPPYELGFMGKSWDASGVAFRVEVWREALRVLKPGGHLLAFSGSRTYHRMAVAIEDAGFEIRDQIMWVYGSGFPKSLDVSKAIDSQDAVSEQARRRFRFTEWVRSQGATPKQIDEATGTQMGYHYSTHPTQPAIMTREHLEACRHLFRDIPAWVERECDIRSIESKNMADREVVGTKTVNGSEGTAGGYANGIASLHGNDTQERRQIDITTPATPEAQRWHGWGTALKPAHEPIVVARKPLVGTVAANVLEHGTGALNIDGCRVEYSGPRDKPTQDEWNRLGSSGKPGANGYLGQVTQGTKDAYARGLIPVPSGRWPANLIHDGSEEVVGMFPDTGPSKSGGLSYNVTTMHLNGKAPHERTGHDDAGGSAARFFYSAKASKRDRDEGLDAMQSGELRRVNSGGLEHDPRWAPIVRKNIHPTVKPTDLMRYLCRLVTPPGGLVLDPFTGSGSTGKGAVLEGFRFLGIELSPEYTEIARARIRHAVGHVAPEPVTEAEVPDALPGQLRLFA